MDTSKQTQLLTLMGELQAERGLDFETRRNQESLDVFEAMIREAFPDTMMVVAGHHLMYTRQGHSVPYEIASADTLIFDHAIATAVWGIHRDAVLAKLAETSPARRDAMLRGLFKSR